MDIKTIFFCLIIINFFLGIFTLIFKKLQKTYPGINYWIISNFLVSIGYFFIILRSQIPNLISIIVGNLCFIFTGFIRIYGLRKLCNIKKNQILNIISIISIFIFIISFIYLTYIINSIIFRTLILSIYLVGLSFYAVFIILKNITKETKMINFFSSLIIMLFSFIHLMRIISWFFLSQTRYLFDSSFFNSITFISNILIDILWTTMFLMMNNYILSFEIKRKNRELEEANIIKDEFFAIIAHDLRSPLIGIIGFLDVVLDRIEGNDIYDLKEYTKIVKNSSKKTIELLENLLIWAKSQMGLNKYEPLLLNVTDFINDIIPAFYNLIESKKIKIDCDIDPSLIIFVDKDMMDTVLRNLITNSIKYSYIDGNIIISGFKKNNDIIITIKDFGMGIKKDDLDKIFKMGNKCSRLGTNNELGSGFGLILCKEFVEKNNGNIWVESEENNGSTFFISFPEYLNL